MLCHVQEFEELWHKLNAVVDGGRISSPDNPQSRKGSSVIDFTREGHFKVTREGRSVSAVQMFRAK